MRINAGLSGLLLLLLTAASASAQTARYEFDGDLSDAIGGFDGQLEVIHEPTTRAPTFVTIDGETAVRVNGDEGVRLPAELAEILAAGDTLSVSLRFRVEEYAPEAGNYLFSYKVNDSWSSPGFFVTVDDRGEDGYYLYSVFGDGGGGPFFDQVFGLGYFEPTQWNDLSLTVDFEQGELRILFNGRFTAVPFFPEVDFAAMREGMREAGLHLGWTENYAHFFFDDTGVVDVAWLELNDSPPPADPEAYRDAVVAMTAGLDGSLGDEEMAALLSVIQLNIDGSYAQARDESDAFIAAYEASRPPLFTDRDTRNISEFPAEDQALLFIQQAIHDEFFVPGNVGAAAGIAFEAAEVYPGRVSDDAPRVSGASIAINASYQQDQAIEEPIFPDGIARPTGFYAAPGERVRITIPPELADVGLRALVGVHRADLSPHTTNLNRFLRISNSFPLNRERNNVANPFGGGIYILVPSGTDAGWVDVTFDGAVKAPFYRKVPGQETDLEEWRELVDSNHVPWADFEGERFMFTFPSRLAHFLDDPEEAMDHWDRFWITVETMLGRSLPRAEWWLLDSRLPGGAYGAGYPMTMDDTQAPFQGFGDGETIWRFRHSPLNIADPDYYRVNAFPEIALHEFGHNQRYPTLGPEVETIPQMVFVAGFNGGLGIDVDEAMRYSAVPDHDRDQAAMDWMMTENFRAGEEMGCDPTMPRDVCHELRYQHRGYAKYVDIANMFGWDKLGDIHRVFYDGWVAQGGIDFDTDKEFVTDDAYLRAAGEKLGVDVRPLFHFWGVNPSEEISAELAKLPPSQAILDRLEHYRSIIPEDQQEFRLWHEINFPGLDAVHFDRYAQVLDEFDERDLGAEMRARVDALVEQYFPALEPAPGVPITAGMNDAWFNADTPGQGMFVTVFPESNSLFLAWFTYEVDGFPLGDAVVGDERHRWITAFGTFEGDRAKLDVTVTSDGVFDDSTVAENSEAGRYGTILLDFDDCANGTLRYELNRGEDAIFGSVPIRRIANDRVPLCEALAAGEAPSPELLEGNPGINDAWFNPATIGQGMLLTAFPASNALFVGWFTHDVAAVPDGEAVVGDRRNRWLTAFGTLENGSATLDVTLSEQGAFDDRRREVVNSPPGTYGTIQIDFSDCGNATVSYDLFAIEQTGTFPIRRIADDNRVLCDDLSLTTARN